MAGRIPFKTEAIALTSLDYGESDRIVTFLTADFGKIRGIAKGARRSRRRFVNTLEPYCRSELVFSRSRREGLALLEDTRALDFYPAIRQDLERSLCASYLIELADLFTLDGRQGGFLYPLLHHFLDLLEEGVAAEALLRFFELRVLQQAGYEPVLHRCMACKAPLGPGGIYRFSVRDGGIRCPACCPEGEGAAISAGALRTLLLAKESPPEKIGRIVLGKRMAEECRGFLPSFVRHILGKEPRSLQVLTEVRRLCPTGDPRTGG